MKKTIIVCDLCGKEDVKDLVRVVIFKDKDNHEEKDFCKACSDAIEGMIFGKPKRGRKKRVDPPVTDELFMDIKEMAEELAMMDEDFQ